MRNALNFFRRWLTLAFRWSWGWAETAATVVAIGVAAWMHYHPSASQNLLDLVWTVPLYVLGGLLAVRVVLAPYWLYESAALERDRALASRDEFLESRPRVEGVWLSLAVPRPGHFDLLVGVVVSATTGVTNWLLILETGKGREEIAGRIEHHTLAPGLFELTVSFPFQGQVQRRADVLASKLARLCGKDVQGREVKFAPEGWSWHEKWPDIVEVPALGRRVQQQFDESAARSLGDAAALIEELAPTGSMAQRLKAAATHSAVVGIGNIFQVSAAGLVAPVAGSAATETDERVHPKEASVGDINITSNNQSGGFTGVLIQGNVHRQLDDNLRSQLLQHLPKGKVGVAAMMGVPDGEALATAIIGFLVANGYTIEQYIQALIAGGMPRGISIQVIENVRTVVINHA